MKSISVNYTEKLGAAGLKVRVEVAIAEKLGLREGQAISRMTLGRIIAMQRELRAKGKK